MPYTNKKHMIMPFNYITKPAYIRHMSKNGHLCHMCYFYVNRAYDQIWCVYFSAEH